MEMDRLPMLFLLFLLATRSTTAGRVGLAAQHTRGLTARLKGDETTHCWESLMELRSCSGEVILFFLNGETYLGPSCCRAIRFIEKHCWAAEVMLTALGFTVQEGDILRGYCEAAEGSPSSSPNLKAKGMTNN